jgi:ABC-type proline/glycine betaine transport system permease subunit
MKLENLVIACIVAVLVGMPLGILSAEELRKFKIEQPIFELIETPGR